MFICCLVSSLSPIVFYQIFLPMFSAGRPPASLLLICVPPRPKTAWLLLRSVVPYRSLFFFFFFFFFLLPLCASTLTWPLSPATLSLYKFALSWLPFSRSAKSFPDRLFYRPGIPFPAPCFLRPDLITAFSFWLRFLDRLFRRPLFPNQPCPTGYLGGRIALCAALLYTCVFTAPLWGRFFWGLCYSAALLLVAPQPSPASGRSQWCLLVSSVPGGPPFLTLFCAAWLTALGELDSSQRLLFS